MNRERTFFAERNAYHWSLDIYGRQRNSSGGFDAMVGAKSGEIVLDFVEEGARPPSPLLRLTHEQGQDLLDALIAAGLRPTKETPPDETIAAQARHINFAEGVATRLLLTMTPQVNTPPPPPPYPAEPSAP